MPALVPNTTNNKIALSIRQPWAWLIIRPDLTNSSADRLQAIREGRIKNIENRTWPSKYRGPLYIHAAKGFTWQEYRDVQEFLVQSDLPVQLPEFESFTRGAIIGRVQMTDCLTSSSSPWFFGPFGFLFSNPEILPQQPLRGNLGFFQF